MKLKNEIRLMSLRKKLKKAENLKNKLDEALEELEREIEDNSNFSFETDYGVECVSGDGVCLTHEEGVLDVKAIIELLEWNEELTEYLFRANFF